tara:strand:- start:1652 stop:2527 length:876 start_codon:yes stop_codon:yes gene_type:complete
MSIKQNGGVFGRNPTFNDVTIEGQLTFDGDIDINSDLKVDGDLEVTGDAAIGTGFTPDTQLHVYSASDLVAKFESADQFADIALKDTGGTCYIRQANGSLTLEADRAGASSNSRIFFKVDNQLAAHFTAVGNLAFESGKGIDFSATAGTGTSELFDDYEEGTFTPSYNTSNSDANVAYASQDGEYTKIGNVVYVDIYLVISSVTSTGSGNIYIEDLPFVAQTGSKTKFTISPYGVNFDAVNFYSLTASAVSNSDKLSIIGIQDNAAWAGASPSNFVVSSGSRIVINGFYFV